MAGYLVESWNNSSSDSSSSEDEEMWHNNSQVHCVLCSVQCIVHRVVYDVYSVHCTVRPEAWKMGKCGTVIYRFLLYFILYSV